MSDTPQENLPTQNEVATPEVMPSSETTENFTKDDLIEAVEKARQQEKDKLYSRLSDMDKKSQEYSKSLEETNSLLKGLVAERDEAKAELDKKAQDELTVEERVAQRLQALEAKEADMQRQLEQVAEQAALRVRASELKLFRANAIADSSLTLTELVRGDTEDEITESIKLAKAREDQIFKKAKEQARNELSQNLPKPAPTPAVQFTQDQQLIDPRKKFEMANLSNAEFQKLKTELLAKAREAYSS